MTKFESPLKNLKIASPCSQDWNAMIGDDRRRYCGECRLNVYNLSGMTRAEAEELVLSAEGRLCVRFYKRADGSVLTQDCPVGWAKVKARTKVYVTALASLIFSFFGALGLVSAFNRTRERVLMGDVALTTPTPTPKSTPGPLMGGITPVKPTPQRTPEATMGNVAIPRDDSVMGKIAAPKTKR
ncbi:MAG: hypothetical protein JSS81_06665 [Acidobacteria bacterium]|nr:hypothetical protein [Acidobacteriota bacterium]